MSQVRALPPEPRKSGNHGRYLYRMGQQVVYPVRLCRIYWKALVGVLLITCRLWRANSPARRKLSVCVGCGIAQLEEHKVLILGVLGSSPSTAAKHNELFRPGFAADLKISGLLLDLGVGLLEPGLNDFGPVAQLVERRLEAARVGGSSPSRSARIVLMNYAFEKET